MIDEDKLHLSFTLIELYEAFLARWEEEHPAAGDVPDFHDFMDWLAYETNKAAALIHVPKEPSDETQ